MKKRVLLIAGICMAIVAGSMRTLRADRPERAGGKGAPRIALIETRRPNGDSEIRVVGSAGKVKAVYKIGLSRHHHPATDANDPVIRRWRSWRFGAFVCFNSNQFTGREFCLAKDPKTYRPTRLDVRQWVSTFQKAGMSHAVLTARHTSGFLLWDSATSEHDVAGSGDRTDVVKAFVEACRRQGVRPGIYYCLWGGKGCSVTGSKEIPQARAAILAQLHELATRCGPIPYFWIDMMCWAPAGLSAREIYDSLKNVHPGTVVILNQHVQDGRQLRYFPTDVLNGEMTAPPAGGHRPLRKVGKATYYLPFEYEPCSQNRSPAVSGGDYADFCWFTYGRGKAFGASKPFSAAFLYRYIRRAYGRGASNVLLACAPDYTGRMRDEDVRQLIELGGMLRDPLRAPPTPLTIGCKGSASGVWPTPRLPASLAFDGDPRTRWGGARNTKAGWLAVDLGRPRTFRRLWVSEGYGRIRRFELQVRKNGAWETIHRGGAMGQDFTATFQPVTARHVRLNILQAADVPTIWEFQLFEK